MLPIEHLKTYAESGRALLSSGQNEGVGWRVEGAGGCCCAVTHSHTSVAVDGHILANCHEVPWQQSGTYTAAAAALILASTDSVLGTGSWLLIAPSSSTEVSLRKQAHPSDTPVCHIYLVLLQAARRSTAASGGGGAVSGAGVRARRTVEGEELAAGGEGLALQSPELLPHFVIDVSNASLAHSPSSHCPYVHMPSTFTRLPCAGVLCQLASSACSSHISVHKPYSCCHSVNTV